MSWTAFSGDVAYLKNKSVISKKVSTEVVYVISYSVFLTKNTKSYFILCKIFSLHFLEKYNDFNKTKHFFFLIDNIKSRKLIYLASQRSNGKTKTK